MLKFITAKEAFNTNHGGSLMGYCSVPKETVARLAAAQGVDANDRNNYYDPDNGYDGWELNGFLNGVPFNIYTRYGTLKIGANFDFCAALNDALRAAALELDQTPTANAA